MFSPLSKLEAGWKEPCFVAGDPFIYQKGSSKGRKHLIGGEKDPGGEGFGSFC